MAGRVLIATRSFGSTSRRPWEILSEAGLEAVQADMRQQMTEERLIELLRDVDAAIVGVVPLTERVLSSAAHVLVICMHGVGVDHIDLKAAARLGITIANCPGANDQAVADLTIGLMLALARQIPHVDADIRAGGWGAHRGMELWKKTLGLVGFGHVGRAVAKRAHGFDMQVLVYDPYISAEQSAAAGVELVDFNTLLSASDFLSLHAGLTDETRNLIGGRALAQMKPTAFLVNTARGGLVDEAALYDALSTGAIAGAALDTFVCEPPGQSPLLALRNVVLTSHIGAHTQEAIERVGMLAAQNVVAALRTGEPLVRVV